MKAPGAGVHAPTRQSLSINRPSLMRSRFVAPWWLRNPHLQTLWPRLQRRGRLVPMRRERIDTDDGDFLDLDWSGHAPASEDAPVVLLIHGLEGNSDSPYAQGMLAAIARHRWRGVVMHFRGCSGELNRLPRSYHSGETGDPGSVIERIRARYPRAPLAVIGYSLGGNVLLKYLGEATRQGTVDAAVAVSVPFLLSPSADRLQQGFSRVYQRLLLDSLKAKTRQKFAAMAPPVDLDGLASLPSIRAFDDMVTAPIHGFADAADYYARNSSRQFLGTIDVPTLIVHAADDPFMTPAVIPAPSELSPMVQLEVSDRGGHVGFVDGPWPWRARHWLEDRVPEFLAAALERR
jgi:predicted alpha/beta-fold hydrolase